MTTPVNRLNWAALAAAGAVALPVLLIAGAPYVFVPSGSRITSVQWTGGWDTAFWPLQAAGPSVVPVRTWLDLKDLTIDVRARPVDGTVDVAAVTRWLYDPKGGPSTLFGNLANLKTTRLTATLSATAAAIPVRATAPFGNPGDSVVLYVGRETILATITDGVTFTSTQRGAYGTTAAVHVGATAGNASVVYSGLRALQGRRATVWMAQVSADGTTLLDPELHCDGRIAPGGGADGARWKVVINSLLKGKGERGKAPTLTVQGFQHYAAAGTRPGAGSYLPADRTPLAINWQDRNCLLTAAGTPGDASLDNGGYSVSQADFVRRWNNASQGITYAHSGRVQLTIRPDGKGSVLATSTTATTGLYVTGGWGANGSSFGTWITASDATDQNQQWVSGGDFPTAFQYFQGGIYFTPAEGALIPNPVTLSQTNVDGTTSAAWFALSAHIGERDYTATITSVASVGTLSLVTVYPQGDDTGGDYGALVTEPTTATLTAWMRCAYWYRGYSTLATLLASAGTSDVSPDSFDFAGIEALAQTDATSPWLPFRDTPVDLGQTFVEALSNEIRLNGMAVTLRYGRISACRFSELGRSAVSVMTLTSADLRQGCDPRVQDATDGNCTVFTVTRAVSEGGPLQFVDAVAQSEVGGGAEVKVTLPRGAMPPANVVDGAWFDRFAQNAQNVLAAFSRPYRVMTLQGTLKWAGLQVGDIVNISEWLTPNDRGGRGFSGLGQILGVTRRFYASGTGGEVDLDIRVSSGIAATTYAPELLVAAGGITAGVGTITVDESAGGLSSTGLSGFADPATETHGGLDTAFQVGDYVQLVEIDNTTPATPYTCQVTAKNTSVHPATITVNPAPTMAWQTLAANALKVLVAFQPYSAATNVANGLAQHDYAFIANRSTGLLGGTDSPDNWQA